LSQTEGEASKGRDKEGEAEGPKAQKQIRFVSDLKADYFRFATMGMADNQTDMLQDKFA